MLADSLGVRHDALVLDDVEHCESSLGRDRVPAEGAEHLAREPRRSRRRAHGSARRARGRRPSDALRASAAARASRASPRARAAHAAAALTDERLAQPCPVAQRRGRTSSHRPAGRRDLTGRDYALPAARTERTTRIATTHAGRRIKALDVYGGWLVG